MIAPPGWNEPAQAPAFDEITLVLAGEVIVDHDGWPVDGGRPAVDHHPAGERIRYSCGPEGAEYVAVCLPAFSPETVNREDGE